MNERLELLRKPFEKHQISKLPKPTKKQTEEVKADFTKGIRCLECGAWHHPGVVHLDYVGHAALTDRLLDVDPLWNWEPLAMVDGLPKFDETGGLWIRLTVCGVTRLGYGHAAKDTNKDIGSREKEVIGDALRNAAMRFGAALDLWHKGDLHVDDVEQSAQRSPPPVKKSDRNWSEALEKCQNLEQLALTWSGIPRELQKDYLSVKDGKKIAIGIDMAQTKEELVAICNALSPEQETQFDNLIQAKMDYFYGVSASYENAETDFAKEQALK